jgi:hypothetical protein
MNYCHSRSLLLSLVFSTCFATGGLLAQTGSVFDDFNRDNTTAATASTDPNPIGAHYVIDEGSWQIGGNSYLNASSAGVMYDNRLETLRSSEYGFSISMDVLHPNYAAGASGRQAGIVLNYQDVNNHYIIRWGNETEGTLGTIQIVKRENGSNTQLGDRVEGLVLPGGWYSWTFASSLEEPNTIAYTVAAQGSETPIYSGSFTDATFTDGNFGFYRSGGGTVRFDNYSLAVIPEPTTSALLLGLGILAFIAIRRRRPVL